jgi:hypothetical protein
MMTYNKAYTFLINIPSVLSSKLNVTKKTPGCIVTIQFILFTVSNHPSLLFLMGSLNVYCMLRLVKNMSAVFIFWLGGFFFFEHFFVITAVTFLRRTTVKKNIYNSFSIGNILAHPKC